MLQSGNVYHGDYVDLTFVTRPTLRISVVVSNPTSVHSSSGQKSEASGEQLAEVQGSKAFFSPDLAEVKEMLTRCVTHIVQAGMELPRVEDVLFPGKSLALKGNCRC